MAGPPHDPDWVEDYTQTATPNWIFFRCTVCGKKATLDRKRYEEGKAMPPMSRHT